MIRLIRLPKRRKRRGALRRRIRSRVLHSREAIVHDTNKIMANSIFKRSLPLLTAALLVCFINHVSARDEILFNSGVAHMSVPEIEEAVLVRFSTFVRLVGNRF